MYQYNNNHKILLPLQLFIPVFLGLIYGLIDFYKPSFIMTDCNVCLIVYCNLSLLLVEIP